MKLNLLDLHDPDSDKNLRQCLRAYAVIPKYAKTPDEKNFSALRINKTLREINKKLKKELGSDWVEKWVELIPYGVCKSSIKDWILGRVSPPLIAIGCLRELGCEKEVDEIFEGLEFISSTTRDVVKIPNTLTPDVLYLTGLILGDGCLTRPKRKGENNFEYSIKHISGDESFIRDCMIPLFKKVFDVDNICFYFNHNAWIFDKKNKALFRFFTKLIGLPFSKKAIRARVPDSVKNLSPEKTIPFFAGLIDSDIGKHSGGMGCTFRSEQLVEDLVEFLARLGVKSRKGGTYIIKGKYPQTDFRIPKSEVKVLKRVMDSNYLPKRTDRLETINVLSMP